MTQELEKRLVNQDRAEWQARFHEAGVPAGPILDTKQAFENEQVADCSRPSARRRARRSAS